MADRSHIYLSVPHLGGAEESFVADVFRSGWLSSVGPHLDAFEVEVAERLGEGIHGLATSSGTAALHLLLRHLGVGPGDRVAVSTLTFAGSVFPIQYLGASPVFIDSEHASWNMDPQLVRQYLRDAAASNTLPKVLVLVHLYGQHADIDPIAAACREHGVILVEDAAESLGARYHDRETATTADYSILSFNGNKIITCTAGGMVIARDRSALDRMRKWANQAREPAVEYLHLELGYNYRLSNVLAAIGRAQLRLLDERVASRRAIAARYAQAFGDIPGVSLQPEAPWGMHTRWLSVIQWDPDLIRVRPIDIVHALRAQDIETRPVWRPMHTQPVFSDAPTVGGQVANHLYSSAICLPSSSSLSTTDQERVIEGIRGALANVLAKVT